MVAPLWVTTMDVRSAYWQFSVSSQHMVKSLTVNPYMSLFAPIFGQQISILDHPLTLDFLVRLGMNFHPMGKLGGRGVEESIGPRTHFLFRTDRNVTT